MAYCAPSSRPAALQLEPLASDPLDPLNLLQGPCILLHGCFKCCFMDHLKSAPFAVRKNSSILPAYPHIFRCTSRLSLKYVQTICPNNNVIFHTKKNTGVVTFTLAKKALGDRHWLDMLDWESHAVSIVTWLDSAARIWCVLAMGRNVPRQT